MSTIIEDNQVETLRNLGLSLVEARTYLHLTKLGTANVKTIAASTRIARQDMYRVLSSLQGFGLVERFVAPTTLFTATPLKEGVHYLIEKKRNDYLETQEKVEKVFVNLDEKAESGNNLPAEIKLKITSEFNLLAATHMKLSQKAKSTIDITLPLSLNRRELLRSFGYIKEAVEHSVKVRVIAQPSKRRVFSETDTFQAGLETRYLPATFALSGMHIFDEKEVTLSLDIIKPLPSLWTNSPHIVEMVTVYFENLWSRAQKT